MAKIKILIASHRDVKFPDNNAFLPIQVGRSSAKDIFDIQGDDTGDNISDRNKYYCELTAVYWAWKNLKDVDYIGLCHYRRYFTTEKISIKNRLKNMFLSVFPALYVGMRRFENPTIIYEKKIISDKLEFDLKNSINIVRYDIINNGINLFTMRSSKMLSRSVRDLFNIIGRYYINQLEIIIKDFYPNYFKDFKLMLDGCEMTLCNMHIMEKSIFEEYCIFIFDVLEKHENMNINEGPSYNRIPGYLGEILTSFFISNYIKNNHTKLRKMNYLLVEDYF